MRCLCFGVGANVRWFYTALLLGCTAVDDRAAVRLFQTECASCHQPGGPASPTFEQPQLAALAPQMLDELDDGIMPPWPPSDRSLPMRDSLALSQHDRRTLRRWLTDGAPVPSDMELRAPGRPVLDSAHTVELPSHVVDGESARCFLLDLPDGLITGFDVRGNKAVHHLLLGVWPTAQREVLRARDAMDPEPGWSCPHAFMPDASPPPRDVPVLWFPSPAPTTSLEGTGAPLGGVGVVQVHSLGHGEVRATVHLRIQRDVLPEIRLALGTGDVHVPENQRTFVVQRRAFVGDLTGGDGLWITGVRAHGHGLLRSVQILSDDEVLLDIPRWDQRFQSRYTLQRPAWIPADALVELICTYDGTTASDDEYNEHPEMCGGWIFGTKAEPHPRRQSRR